jgi:hypothetical protein
MLFRRPARPFHGPIALALFVAPLVAVSANGCSTTESTLEDLCGWLRDPANCYRTFAADIDASCGTEGLGSAKKGGFLSRDKLDICVLSQGGQVIFDPPVDVASFPLQTAAFKLINADGTSCGAASYGGSEYLFSVKIEPNPLEPAPDADPETTVSGGTFSVTAVEGNDIFDATCPAGDAHRFDRLQSLKCSNDAVAMPRAELESNPGGIDLQGFVRFRVFYAGAVLDDTVAESTIVEYFDCSVPGAPKPCVNGAQDGVETDVDCGGDQCAGADPATCTACARCDAGLKCNEDADCISGNCALVMGIRKCGDPVGSGAGGGGGAGTGGGGGAGGG